MDFADARAIPPIPRATVSCARTLDEAGAALSAAYSDVTVRVPDRQRRLQMRLKTIATSNLALGDLELTSSVVRSARFPWFAVCLPVRGEIRVTTHRSARYVAGQRGAIVAPGDPADVEYLSPICHMRTVLIERDALEAELAAMLGHTVVRPVSFEPAIVHDGGDALGRSLALLAAEGDGPNGLMTHSEMAPRLGRLVIAGLLTSCPHNYSEELDRPAGGQQPRAIRVAIDAIEAHPAEFTTVADIARVAALSVRALDAGFRRHVGVPPMTYLRRVRLARVHTDLIRADPGEAGVSTIARRWGFLHHGRFAAAYRDAYGRSPAQTLRGDGRLSFAPGCS
jgi:AraC-like DNA-binding protein